MKSDKKRPIGRPMKYKEIIMLLDNNELYTPASIAAFAEKIGFVRGGDNKARRLDKQRIRISLGRFSNNHEFPDEGDGMVLLWGQAPTPGWFGWRWKEAAAPKSSE